MRFNVLIGAIVICFASLSLAVSRPSKRARHYSLSGSNIACDGDGFVSSYGTNNPWNGITNSAENLVTTCDLVTSNDEKVRVSLFAIEASVKAEIIYSSAIEIKSSQSITSSAFAYVKMAAPVNQPITLLVSSDGTASNPGDTVIAQIRTK